MKSLTNSRTIINWKFSLLSLDCDFLIFDEVETSKNFITEGSNCYNQSLYSNSRTLPPVVIKLQILLQITNNSLDEVPTSENSLLFYKTCLFLERDFDYMPSERAQTDRGSIFPTSTLPTYASSMVAQSLLSQTLSP